MPTIKPWVSVIDSKGDVNLDAVNTSYQSNAIGDANNYYKQGESRDIGSQINGTGDIVIKSGKSVTGTATQINSESGTVGVQAADDITFKEGRHTQNLSTAAKTVDKGTFSTTKTQDRYDMQSDQTISTEISGNKAVINAGRDVSLTGTNAVSDQGTYIKAGRNVDILAAENTFSESSEHQEKKSGAFATGSGIGFTIGKQQTDNSNARTAKTHTASNVGAIDGNVIIEAGNHYQQTGSNVIAGMGADTETGTPDANRGNVAIKAKDIDIDNAMDVYTNQSEESFKKSGITVSVSNSLIDGAKSIDALTDAAGNTDSNRMKGMAAVSGALKVRALAKQSQEAAANLIEKGISKDGLKGLGNTRIQATVGSEKRQSNSESYNEKSQGSTVQAAGNLSLEATGGGTKSNININGSDIDVVGNALFKADNDFNVNGVAQNERTRSSNKSSSYGVGGYADTSGSAGITANASGAKGHGNSDATTYANSHINVGGTTTFDIGNDLNFKGGVFNTTKAQGNIGGDVNIESLQDTATYDGKQRNIGFSADIDLNAGKGTNFSLNGGKTDISADHAAVGEQSGIFTGDGGFDMIVEGKTTLKGGAITITQAALDNGLNKYTSKGGIETSDIDNYSRYEGNSIQAGISIGSTNGKPQGGMNGMGYGTDGDDQTSTTFAGVTGMAGKSEATTGTRDILNEPLVNSFDEQKVTEELNAQTQITKEFGKEAPKAVGDFAKTKTKPYETAVTYEQSLQNALPQTTDPKQRQLIEQELQKVQTYKQVHEQDYHNWKEGGAYRVAAHTALGAFGTGTLEGALTTGGVAAAAPVISDLEQKMADKLVEQGMSADIAKSTANVITSVGLAGVGTATGLDTSSTATAVNVDANNRQLHPQEIRIINDNAKAYATKKGISLIEAKRQLTKQALRQVDSSWHTRIAENKEARAYLATIGKSSGWSLSGYQPYTTSNKDYNDQTVNAEFIYQNRANYNLIQDKQGRRGSYLAIADASSDYRDWEGKNQQEYIEVAKQFGPLGNEASNYYENNALGSASHALKSNSVTIGGMKENSAAAKELTAAMGTAYLNSFHTDGAGSSGNVRMSQGKSGASSQLPRTTGNSARLEIIPAKYRTKIDDQLTIIKKDESIPPWIQESFKDNHYRTAITKKDITVYRVYGGKAKATGGFVTTTPAKDKIQAKIDMALLPEWKNTRIYEAKITIPKGTIINIGRVAPQTIKESGTILKGDSDQILMPRDWPTTWIKSTREVKP